MTSIKEKPDAHGAGAITRSVWGIALLFIFILLASAALDVTKLRNAVLDEKSQQTRQLVEAAHSLLEHYEQLVVTGKFNEMDAQKAAIAAISKLRYGQSDYFWIHDRSTPVPRMVMHPTQPQLDGQILNNPVFETATHYRDNEAVDFSTLAQKQNTFTVFNEVIERAGKGFVRYEWPKPGARNTEINLPKLSYVQLFQPWDWVIGTGIYIDDIDQMVDRQVAYLLTRTVICALLVLLATILIVRKTGGTEARLFNQRVQMQALIDATSESVLLLDAKGHIQAINRYGAERFQKHPLDMLGSNFFDLLPESLAKTRRTACDEVVTTGEPMLLRDNRNGIAFENSIYPVRNHQHQVVGVAVYAKDVTEQQRSAAIEELFHHLDTVVLKWQMDPLSVAQIFSDGLLPIFNLAGIWIGRIEPGGSLNLFAVSQTTDTSFINPEHLPKQWRCPGNPDCRQYCPHRWPMACLTIQSGQKHFNAVNPQTDDPHMQDAIRAGIQAALAIPISLHDEKWGVLVVYTRHLEALEKAQRLLQTLTGRLGAVLESAMHQEKNSLFDAALTELSTPICILNQYGSITLANPAFCDLLQLRESNLKGAPMSALLHTTDSTISQAVSAAIQQGATWKGEVSLSAFDAPPISCTFSLRPLHNPQKDATPHFLGVVEAWLNP